MAEFAYALDGTQRVMIATLRSRIGFRLDPDKKLKFGESNVVKNSVKNLSLFLEKFSVVNVFLKIEFNLI
ncbi:MAG TPA: hypothetical protein EYQ63_07575 [Fuerstia sp.]|nr:hypothetical protein [Fuerstiella sp.]